MIERNLKKNEKKEIENNYKTIHFLKILTDVQTLFREWFGVYEFPFLLWDWGMRVN